MATTTVEPKLTMAPTNGDNKMEVFETNPFLIAQHQLDEAAELLELDEATHQMLRWPMRELRSSDLCAPCPSPQKCRARGWQPCPDGPDRNRSAPPTHRQ